MRRSIPACTGEPRRESRSRPANPVYPRVYGGTFRTRSMANPAQGLSPRVRGNRAAARLPRLQKGSIPACTGEPRSAPGWAPKRTVYPRVYGGTAEDDLDLPDADGLSPRVRGNPSEKAVASGCVRSIPACTGEPHSSRSDNTSHRVYPRVYGGTGPIHGQGLAINGLSPRVRGNPVSVNVARSALRSIPACTGEPTASLPAGVHVKVYPRVYGGTQLGRVAGNQALGLSPRVRGNLLKTSICAPFIRSIPACTGEPWTRLSRR